MFLKKRTPAQSPDIAKKTEGEKKSRDARQNLEGGREQKKKPLFEKAKEFRGGGRKKREESICLHLTEKGNP